LLSNVISLHFAALGVIAIASAARRCRFFPHHDLDISGRRFFSVV
jgi:hypothetical protein